MARSSISEDLRLIVISALEEVATTVIGPADSIDTAVTRLDSIVESIHAVTEHVQISWSANVVRLLEQAMDELSSAVTSAGPSRGVGRPRIEIPPESIENLLALNFKVPRIARMLAASTDTIFRRMRDHGLSVADTYTRIPDDDFRQLVVDILANFPNTGYKRMKGFLYNRGVKVTEYRIREVMRIVDPSGVYHRTTQNRAIYRRQYNVEYSNQLWHLDTNLKLIRWNIVVRSCIDGKSRTVVYLDASNDNRAGTNFNSFVSAIGVYGVPLRTRSDKGGENVMIARYMIETRGSGRASHICGRWVHNQRIERLWRDVFAGCLGTYYALFSRMEDEGILNLDNPKHVYILHWIFIPRLNAHLQEFMESWNWHPISTERNFSPRQLMTISLPPREFDCNFQPEHYPGLDFPCNSFNDLEQFHEAETLTVPGPMDMPLNPVELDHLRLINPLEQSESFGYNIFLSAMNGMHWASNE